MSLQVWLPLDGNLNNQGLASCSVTAGGGVSVNNNGKIGQCYKTNGTDGYLTIPASTMTSFGTACTVCFWAYVETWPVSYSTFFQAGPNTSDSWGQYNFGFLRLGSSNNVAFVTGNGSSSTQENCQTTITLNQWHHFCGVYDNKVMKFYYDGALVATFSSSYVANFANITNITLMQSNNRNHYLTNMRFNDFRIYDEALDINGIHKAMNFSKALYYPFIHYPLNGQPQSTQTIEFDISGNHNDAIASTNLGTFIKNSDPNPIRYPSYYFFNNRYIRKTDLIYNGNQYSISCWINTSAVPTNFEMIYSWNNNVTTSQENAKCRLYLGQTTTALTCQFEKQSQVVSTNSLNINTWYHVTITYDGTACKMYINGEMDNSSNGSSQISNASILTIGGGHTATNQAYPCTHVSISDFRFYTKCLNADEVSTLYHMGNPN